jgi:hypothetical protein
VTWPQWIARVLAIAESRSIAVRVEYPAPGLATFIWRCLDSPMNGVAGAGESMIHLTTPEQFTALWVCGGFVQPAPGEPLPAPGANPLQSLIDRLLIDRRGRFVPRRPAYAVLKALEVLF